MRKLEYRNCGTCDGTRERERENGRRETGDGRRETGDERRKTGDARQEMGHGMSMKQDATRQRDALVRSGEGEGGAARKVGDRVRHVICRQYTADVEYHRSRRRRLGKNSTGTRRGAAGTHDTHSGDRGVGGSDR